MTMEKVMKAASPEERKTRATRMSDAMSKTMLYYDSHRNYGIAKSGGVCVEITSLPSSIKLPKQTTNVSFYHELHDYRLKESTEPVRDMRPPEIEAIHQFLASLANFGKRLRKSWRKAL